MSLTACIGSLGVVWAAGGPMMLLAAGVYGGVSFAIYSLCAAHTNDFADPEKRVQTASGLLIAYAVGAISGPIVMGLLMGYFDARALFFTTAVVQGFLGLFALYRMTRRRTLSAEERTGVINLPGGAPTAGELYRGVRDSMDRDLARMSGAGSERDAGTFKRP